MTPMHPGVNMVNALINDFDRVMELERRAPGADRPAGAFDESTAEASPPPPLQEQVEEKHPADESLEELKEEKKEEGNNKQPDRASKKYGAIQGEFLS